MSTAVLMSGQARSFAHCFPTQQWHVYRHFPDLHFYVLWQNDAQAAQGVKLLVEKYGVDRVHAKLINDPTDLPMIPLAKGVHAPYLNAAPHPQLLMQHWYQNELWKFYVEQKLPEVHRVIRMRGDNWFHSFKLPTDAHIHGAEFRAMAGMMTDEQSAFLPWWGRFGGVNDRFAILGPKAAESYFTVYPEIEWLLSDGCPFHPESLLKATLKNHGAKCYDTLLAEFSTLRMNGEMRRYESEVQPADTANLVAR